MVMNMMSGGHEPTTTRPLRPKRANAKSQVPKKPPQRGLGVAQLERLRLQENFNKMTGMTPEFNLLHPGTAVLDPSPTFGSGGIPLTCSTPTPGYSAPSNPYHHQLLASGSSGFFTPAGIPRGLEGMPRSAGSCGGGGYYGNLAFDHGDVVSGRVVSSPFGDLRMLQHGVCNFDPSKELSSRPNGSCEFCVKKKRIDEQNMDYNRSLRNMVKCHHPDTTKVNNIGRDYIGVKHTQQNPNFFSPSGLNLSARDSTSAFKTYRNPDQVLEDVRKNMSYGGSSNSREYEFFPGKNGRSTSSEGQIFPAVGLVAVNPDEASNSIDLTLKL